MALPAKNPEAALVFIGSAFIDAQGNRSAHILHVPEKNNRKKLLGQNVISCSFVLIRKDLIYRRSVTSKSGQKSKSAQMNWRTYIRAGISLGTRVIAMMKYTMNG